MRLIKPQIAEHWLFPGIAQQAARIYGVLACKLQVQQCAGRCAYYNQRNKTQYIGPPAIGKFAHYLFVVGKVKYNCNEKRSGNSIQDGREDQ